MISTDLPKGSEFLDGDMRLLPLDIWFMRDGLLNFFWGGDLYDGSSYIFEAFSLLSAAVVFSGL